jgi:hypothetical protein
LDIILRKIRKNNIFFGGLLIIASMDHRQLPPVTGKPFLMSSHVLSCFKFSVLDHSVRASQDSYLERTVNIARMHPDLYTCMDACVLYSLSFPNINIDFP